MKAIFLIKHTILLTIILVLSCRSISESNSELLPEIIGCAHTQGKYFFSNEDFLNEGGDVVEQLGSKVIKVWFFDCGRQDNCVSYPFNSKWPAVSSAIEGAKTQYFRNLFSRPFKTYILEIRSKDYWDDGISQEQKADEEKKFYDFSKYLLTTYRKSGKTFVLQNWEGDWLSRMHTNPDKEANSLALDSMITWFNARQAGVNKARKEVGEEGVHVYHAAEVNIVLKSMWENQSNVVNRVLPFTNVDLVSYSFYECIGAILNGRPEVLGEAIDYIKKNAPDSNAFGNNNVYIGEFGIPENDYSKEQVLKVLSTTVNTGIDKACPYIIFWQTYCNELKDPNTPVPVKNNKDVRGFWLIRPDGTKSWAWDYLHNFLVRPKTQKD